MSHGVTMQIHCEQVDYNHPTQSAQLVALLNHYASDPMGGGKPLSENVQQNLTATLAQTPGASSFIIYANGKPAGLANCFETLSTFACRSILNIHDFVIHAEFRGMGLSKTLMQHVADYAKAKGCIKLTLEVLSGNKTAYQAYIKSGFKLYQLDPEHGSAQFMEKYL